jgi:hypothetical protein
VCFFSLSGEERTNPKPLGRRRKRKKREKRVLPTYRPQEFFSRCSGLQLEGHRDKTVADMVFH